MSSKRKCGIFKEKVGIIEFRRMINFLCGNSQNGCWFINKGWFFCWYLFSNTVFDRSRVNRCLCHCETCSVWSIILSCIDLRTNNACKLLNFTIKIHARLRECIAHFFQFFIEKFCSATKLISVWMATSKAKLPHMEWRSARSIASATNASRKSHCLVWIMGRWHHRSVLLQRRRWAERYCEWRALPCEASP